MNDRKRRVAEIFIGCFHGRKKKNHALTTFQFVTDMRWFRGHAEAPRLLRLSPLRADEDVNETSYHFHVTSRCRGKSRLKWRRVISSRCRKRKRRRLGATAARESRLILAFIPPVAPGRIGEKPNFLQKCHTASRAARVFACRPASCAWRELESGFHPECGDYDSTFRQAEFPSDWPESENRSKLTLRPVYANAR